MTSFRRIAPEVQRTFKKEKIAKVFSFFLFFLSNILFLYDIFSGNSCRITDSTVNQNSLKPYKSMSGSRTSSINITQKLARNA